jgi:stage IV sporulation protein B
MDINFIRDGKKYKANLLPVKSSSDGKYKAGLWVRDSTAGIGTITFYNPDDGSFAGLGHGIYDSETELLLPLSRGAVVGLDMEDILKGKTGHPGELKGSFGTEKKGSLLKNTTGGVFGVLSTPPETVSDPLPCALKGEVVKGDAYILSNVDGRGVKKYSINIDKIYSGNEATKNFVISVTDERLLELTGGIVRGMSGSPIIQNDKLVGAVTHVLVNDPTRGYGIFIENMLKEAR